MSELKPCDIEKVGRYLASKYWDGLHDHPQASHCRGITFEQYFELNKDGYIGEATGLLEVLHIMSS